MGKRKNGGEWASGEQVCAHQGAGISQHLDGLMGFA